MHNKDLPLIKAGVIQLEAKINEYGGNVERAMLMIEECAAKGCHLVCLPEAFSTTIDLGGAKKVAEEIPGKTSELLCQKAKEKKIHIIAGILEKEKDNIFSSAVLINDIGEIAGVYRRAHIYQLEKRFLKAGNTFKVFDTSIARIGIIMGYDINFPESSRILFRQKAEIIVCPSQIPITFSHATTLLSVARATENSCYFILVNSVGENTFARLKYMGNSMITRSPVALDQYGSEYVQENEIIAKADANEAIIYGVLDLTRLRREQEENPHYKDALPMSYFLTTGGEIGKI